MVSGPFLLSLSYRHLSRSHTRARTRTHLSLVVFCGTLAHINRHFFFVSEACFVVQNRGQWGLSGGYGMEKSVVCDPHHVQPVGRAVDH